MEREEVIDVVEENGTTTAADENPGRSHDSSSAASHRNKNGGPSDVDESDVESDAGTSNVVPGLLSRTAAVEVVDQPLDLSVKSGSGSSPPSSASSSCGSDPGNVVGNRRRTSRQVSGDEDDDDILDVEGNGAVNGQLPPRLDGLVSSSRSRGVGSVARGGEVVVDGDGDVPVNGRPSYVDGPLK
jgi:hypothetical protein